MNKGKFTHYLWLDLLANLNILLNRTGQAEKGWQTPDLVDLPTKISIKLALPA